MGGWLPQRIKARAKRTQENPPALGRMCQHHKPAHKLQRFGLYLLAGALVLMSQVYPW